MSKFPCPEFHCPVDALKGEMGMKREAGVYRTYIILGKRRYEFSTALVNFTLWLSNLTYKGQQVLVRELEKAMIEDPATIFVRDDGRTFSVMHFVLDTDADLRTVFIFHENRSPA